MADRYSLGSAAPSGEAFAITPNDNTDLTTTTRAIYIGGNGDLKVDLAGEGTVTFVGVTAGTIYPISVKRVYSTGTTATNIVGLR